MSPLVSCEGRGSVGWGGLGWGDGECTRCLLTRSEVGVCLHACVCGSVRGVLGQMCTQ